MGLWFPPTAKVCNCAVNKTELDIKRTDNNRDKVTVHPGNLPPIPSTDFSYDAGWLTWTVLPKCKIFVYSSFLKSLSWNNVWICGKWALLVILKKKKVILKKKKKDPKYLKWNGKVYWILYRLCCSFLSNMDKIRSLVTDVTKIVSTVFFEYLTWWWQGHRKLTFVLLQRTYFK